MATWFGRVAARVAHFDVQDGCLVRLAAEVDSLKGDISAALPGDVLLHQIVDVDGLVMDTATSEDELYLKAKGLLKQARLRKAEAEEELKEATGEVVSLLNIVNHLYRKIRG